MMDWNLSFLLNWNWSSDWFLCLFFRFRLLGLLLLQSFQCSHCFLSILLCLLSLFSKNNSLSLSFLCFSLNLPLLHKLVLFLFLLVSLSLTLLINLALTLSNDSSLFFLFLLNLPLLINESLQLKFSSTLMIFDSLVRGPVKSLEITIHRSLLFGCLDLFVVIIAFTHVM